MKSIAVLRLGHRPTRDKRITTHVCLVARAFGAQGAYISGSKDESLRSSILKISTSWGGNFWIEFISNPLHLVKDWKQKGGLVVHLTMYGLPVGVVKERMVLTEKDILIIVGGEKVPGYYYGESDFNISIGNQPHSEVAALAILLDRISNGAWESLSFGDAQIRVIPSERGKNVKQLA